MSKSYFSEDGNYGDATHLAIVDNDLIPEVVWEWIDWCHDSTRYEIARAIVVNDYKYLQELAEEDEVDLKIACAWCDKPVMWEYACPNAEDICVYCCSDCYGE